MMNAAPVTIHPIYAVVGRDPFLRNERLGNLLEDAMKDSDSLGPARFNGAQAALADVLDEVRTASLLGDRRVVIVDAADPFIKANRAALERYASTPSDTGSLILLCDALAKNTRLYRIINENGKVITCPAPTGRSLIDWISVRARIRYGKSLSHGDAQMLRDHLGDGLGILDTELGKLAAYTGERKEIRAADISALTGHHREEKVFAVMDAMSSGDVEAAIGHWEQVLATDRAAPARAIAGLAWGLRRLLEARRDWEGGADLGELARRMYTDPATLRRRLERVTTDKLETQQRDLLSADLAVKTGASRIDLAVERFIVAHSAGSR